MPLESISEMMSHASRHRYAVGYFESWSLESLQGVIDAAEKTRSPIIIGFNGDFLSHKERIVPEKLSVYGELGRAVAETAGVPCGFVFNECSDDDWVRDAITSGFNLVMPTDPSAGFEESIDRVVALTRFAHENGVAVEGELGELPDGLHDGSGGSTTDPELASIFVRETGIDLLAVSVGNIHVQLSGRRSLDLDHIARLKKALEIPLVLHGGSGIEDSSLFEAIGLGVTKVNFGTYLKQRYVRVLKEKLKSEYRNPHELVGMGGDLDIVVAGRTAVRDSVTERLPLLGCEGRA